MLRKSLLLLLLLSGIGAIAQSNFVDASFGTNGIIDHTITVNNVLHGVEIKDVYRLPDGKILGVGSAKTGCSGTWTFSGLLMRFNPNGEFDTTLNGQGYKLFAGLEGFNKLLPIDNQQFVIVGVDSMVRINSEGIIDTSFGNNGYLSHTLHFATAVHDSSNNYYVIGRRNPANVPVLAKFNAQGSIDTTFGTNGEIVFPASYQFSSLQLDPNGKIVVIGREFISTTNIKLLVARLGTTGNLDTSFADNGVFKYTTWSTSFANELSIDMNGTITGFASGTLTSTSGLGLILFRLNNNGVLDTTFNNNGIVSIPVQSDSAPHTVHHYGNGDMVITGTGYNTMYAIKVNSNGFVNTTFGNNGKIITSSFEWTGYNTSSLLIGDKILFIGNSAFAHCAQQKYKAVLMCYNMVENTMYVQQNEKDFNITTYPNPVKDNLTIKSGILSKSDFSITIFSSTGQKVTPVSPVRLSDNEMEVSTSSLASGVYYLSITTDDNTFTSKFLKN